MARWSTFAWVALSAIQALAQTGMNCPPGGFWDAQGGGRCYYCPLGFNRTLEGILSDRACGSATALQTTAAIFKQSAQCPSGTFFDLKDFSVTSGGTCWSCPSNTQRTVFPVSSDQACTVGIFGPYGAASKRGYQCPAGTFIDPRNGGECWQCPPGTDRTASAVNAGDACSRAATYADAVSVSFSGGHANPVRPPFTMRLGTSSLCIAQSFQLDSTSGSPSPMILKDCNDGAILWKVGSRGEMESGNTHYDHCLEIGGSDTKDGAKVMMWNCHYASNQLWDLTATGQIRSRMNGKCVDVPNSNAQSGVALQMYTCNGGAAQRWTAR